MIKTTRWHRRIIGKSSVRFAYLLGESYAVERKASRNDGFNRILFGCTTSLH